MKIIEPVIGESESPTQRTLKILYHHRTASSDGQAVHIGELIGAFRRLGCEVILVEPPAPAANEGRGESLVSAIRRIVPKAAGELIELLYNVVAYARLRSAYLRHRPDF